MLMSEAAKALGLSVTRARTVLLKHLDKEKDMVPGTGKKSRWEIPADLVEKVKAERAGEVADTEDFQKKPGDKETPPKVKTPGWGFWTLLAILALIYLSTQTRNPEQRPGSQNW